MAVNAIVQARIKSSIKEDATKVLAEIGLTVSDVVKILLTRIAKEKSLPFDTLIPNKKTISTIEKSERGEDVYVAKDAEDLFKQLEI